MTDEQLAKTLAIDPASFADVAHTVAEHPRARIVRAPIPLADASDGDTFEVLVAAREQRGIVAGLELGRTIGEGGMGVVRTAVQKSLARTVAVKMVRPETRSPAATMRLLREAKVTGALEHPSIVPVYDLGLDEDGSAVIVLKRIDGIEWGALIRSETLARERFGDGDVFEHHVRILIQLCHAVSLAHARGVLHRDLKPENVMIGSFGEVYLVDWGLAVSTKKDNALKLPLAVDQTEMAGTPSYMAPEMLGARGVPSERTDVYLLGAILHEILTGEPPHRGSFSEIIRSILASRFEYGEHVPAQLALVAKQAMSARQEDRFASPDELRLRLEWYLRHRGSLAISTAAGLRLEEMRVLLTGPADAALVHDRLYALFAECRFGFQQALAESPDNDTARRGLAAAIELVVGFELENDAPQAAASALAEHPSPPPDLAERVATALRDRSARAAEMKRMDAALNPLIGGRARLVLTIIFGLTWVTSPQVVRVLVARNPDYPHWMPYVQSAGALVTMAVLMLMARRSLAKTRINRFFVAGLAVSMAGQLALEVGVHLLSISRVAGEALHLLVWGVATTFSASVQPRHWISVAAFFMAFLVAAAFPERRWDMMSLSFAVICVVSAISSTSLLHRRAP